MDNPIFPLGLVPTNRKSCCPSINDRRQLGELFQIVAAINDAGVEQGEGF
jgi:hypothetical protein